MNKIASNHIKSLEQLFVRSREKHKQSFSFWHYVWYFYLWQNITGKKFLTLWSITELRGFNCMQRNASCNHVAWAYDVKDPGWIQIRFFRIQKIGRRIPIFLKKCTVRTLESWEIGAGTWRHRWARASRPLFRPSPPTPRRAGSRNPWTRRIRSADISLVSIFHICGYKVSVPEPTIIMMSPNVTVSF